MNSFVNPNDFVITRRRKKYKFAKFAAASNCFEFEQWQKQSVDVLEVGAGTGLFGVELAKRHPDWRLVALDVKADRLQKGAYQALEQSVDNVQFVRARADQLLEIVTVGSVRAIWLTFPDPYPKERSEGRRLTHFNFLQQYQKLLMTDGELLLKHDDPEFFAWSIAQLKAAGWQIKQLVDDLHTSDAPADAKILTTYEQRWIREGRTPQFVAAQPPQNASAD